MPWAKVASGTSRAAPHDPERAATGSVVATFSAVRRPGSAACRRGGRAAGDGCRDGAGPGWRRAALLISFFSASAWVPKIAWTLLPTSMTPAAPSAFSRAWSTLLLVGDLHPQPGDAGVDVDQVVPAAEGGDQLLRRCWPPAGAERAAPPAVSSVRLARCSASNSSSGSRPGVRMFHRLIAKRNRK